MRVRECTIGSSSIKYKLLLITLHQETGYQSFGYSFDHLASSIEYKRPTALHCRVRKYFNQVHNCVSGTAVFPKMGAIFEFPQFPLELSHKGDPHTVYLFILSLDIGSSSSSAHARLALSKCFNRRYFGNNVTRHGLVNLILTHSTCQLLRALKTKSPCRWEPLAQTVIVF